ncbi:MAG: hypothetical protein MJ168_07360 [Clostridia bacterium]|nr:hypothetical protein [Clostridia bacterium]
MKPKYNEKFTFFLSCLVILTLIITDFSTRTTVKNAMASRAHIPITCVENHSREVALTYNLHPCSDIDFILSELGDTTITFFADESTLLFQPQKIKAIRSKGHEVGILRSDLKGRTQQEIFDIIADTIEEFSFISEKNNELVRFEMNLYDSNAVRAVFTLGLYPVQWSTDSTVGNYTEGDIILITDDTDIGKLLEKINADGLKTVPVGKLLIKNNYKIDLSGEMINN